MVVESSVLEIDQGLNCGILILPLDFKVIESPFQLRPLKIIKEHANVTRSQRQIFWQCKIVVVF